MERPALICKGELLLNLRYIRNTTTSRREPEPVNYCLDCGISETILQTAQTKGGWTTVWITVPPKHNLILEINPIWWTTAWFAVLPKQTLASSGALVRWATTWFTVPPKHAVTAHVVHSGWTTTWITVPPKHQNGYDTSFWWMNYCLIYGTSETARVRQAHPNPVNYCLDYRTSETVIRAKGYLFGWTTTWITVPPKPSSSFVPIKLGLN